MSHIILTQKIRGAVKTLNVQIAKIDYTNADDQRGSGTYLNLTSGISILVRESPERIDELIRERNEATLSILDILG